MLQRVRDLLTSDDEPLQKGDIWLQRMTYEGGWERMLANVAPEEFLDCPTSDDSFLITLPGRYRAIKRVNGRLDEVLWKYETDDADEYYETQQKTDQQRERLYAMSVEDLGAELLGGTNELDELSYSEIQERFEELGGWAQLLS